MTMYYCHRCGDIAETATCLVCDETTEYVADEWGQERQRERYEDDGQTYADPGDFRDGRE